MFLFPRMFLPLNNDRPPTLYAFMNSMANYGEDEKTKIKDLALATHERIFNFTYPLSTHVNKTEFEVMILNHFLMRRIGYDSMTAFQIALNVKLNEIMPMYNKLFDMLDGWDLFSSGEVYTRTSSDARTTVQNGTVNSVGDTSSTSDRRFSELPQNQLSDLRNGTYVTDYNYDTNTDHMTNSTANNNTINDMGNINEQITRTPTDKIRIYKEFIENKKSIYTMIFEDLDSLFFGLV